MKSIFSDKYVLFFGCNMRDYINLSDSFFKSNGYCFDEFLKMSNIYIACILYNTMNKVELYDDNVILIHTKYKKFH